MTKRQSSTPPSRAALYRKAARQHERQGGGFSCNTLKNVGASDRELARYKEVFAPTTDHECWLHTEPTMIQDYSERQAWRSLALCFMAAMVEAGDA